MRKQLLPLSEVSNARQLGGYPCAGGRCVKDGVLLRSGALSGASPQDIEILTGQYGLKAVIDLRTGDERAGDPDPEIPGVVNIHLPVLDESLNAGSQAAIVEIYRLCGDDIGRAYAEMVRAGALSEDMYSVFFDSQYSMGMYRKFFDVLLEHDEGAVLWHCTGGKDRAGLASVMLLGLLGADEETILADFALSNEVYHQNIEYIVSAAGEYTGDAAELEQIAALAGVCVPHMQLVLDRAKAECGSMQAFLQEKIGLTDEEAAALRDKYLE